MTNLLRTWKLLLLLSLVFASCKKGNMCGREDDAVIYWTGEKAVDGCDWVVSINEESYHPSGLSDAFKVDRLKVKVEYTIKSGKYDYPCSMDPNRVLKTIDVVEIDRK